VTGGDNRAPLRTAAAVGPPAVLAACAAAAALLPWWREERGAVLLGAARRELPPEVLTGVDVAGRQAAVVAMTAGVAMLLAVAALATVTWRSRRPERPGPDEQLVLVARCVAAGAGAAAAVGAVRVVADWGTGGTWGAAAALVAGLAAVAAALPWSGVGAGRRRSTVPVLAAVLLGAAVVAVPHGPEPPDRSAVGPFVPVAAVGDFPLRSGAPGLAASGAVQPALVDGAAGVVSGAGIVVADARGRARVLAETDRGAPAPIGVAGDRVAWWSSADTVTVSRLRADDPLHVVVYGVVETGPVGADGSVWLRSDADPVGTIRRLDLAQRDGDERVAATFLPVVTIQEPAPPVDVRSVLPVRGGGLRPVTGAGRWELLTGTAAGIAASPLVGARCGAAGTASLEHAAADGTGVWFVLAGPDGDRLAHLEPGGRGAIATVPALLPGEVSALAAPGDGSLLFVARDATGAALWRLPDPAAALTGPAGPPVTCPPVP
jgi:hypothetical protein